MKIPWKAPLFSCFALSGLLLSTGCAGLRAQVGVGTGFGAVVHIPAVAKFGACGGSFLHAGHDYDRGWSAGTGSQSYGWDTMLNVLGAWHSEGQTDGSVLGMSEGESMAVRNRFDCSFLPPLTGSLEGTYHPWSLELDVMLLLVDLRLGINPWFWKSDEPAPEPAAPASS